MKFRSFLFGVVALAGCCVFTAPVFAQTAPTAPTAPTAQQTGSALTNSAVTRLSVPIGGKQEVGGLPEYINTVYQYMLGVVTILAIIMVMYGAFLFLLSHGDAKKVSDGQKIIRDAIGGMAVLFLAYFILYNINPRTTRLDLVVTPIRSIGMEVGRGCAQNADCPTGQYCSQTSIGSACVTSPFEGTSVGGITCTTRTDCPEGARCGGARVCEEVSGYFLCTDSNQCPNGQTCVSQTKICCADEACRSIQGLCGERDVCPTGTRCYPEKQVCRVAARLCTTVRQCERDETCVSGECRPPVRIGNVSTVNPQNAAPVAPGDAPIATGSRAEFETCTQNQDCRTGLVCARLRTRSMCARPS